MCMHRVRLRLGSGSLKGSGASDCVCFLWVTSSQAHAMQIAITNYFLFVEHGGVFSCSPGTEVSINSCEGGGRKGTRTLLLSCYSEVWLVALMITPNWEVWPVRWCIGII
ncbi:hypothetical protein GOODEAATRI_008017 [Goodea atripinnis]|uniref:Secreted protein n=1 Tax=Goodea atripinnis TaxID=208336 RepID=A0ABV0NSR3_9TELE